jgi:hypothetical protein
MAGPVRHMRVTVALLKTESDLLARHVVVGLGKGCLVKEVVRLVVDLHLRYEDLPKGINDL